MDREKKTQEVAAVLQDAFAAAAGSGEDWPYEVASRATPGLARQLGCAFTRTDLVRLLADIDDEREARGSDAERVRYSAEHLVERFVPEEGEELILYQFPSCPFCVRVRRVIDRLGIDVEMRDILQNPQHRQELLEARGRATVPVLRCKSSAGDRWMPESRDIIHHLEARYGSRA